MNSKQLGELVGERIAESVSEIGAAMVREIAATIEAVIDEIQNSGQRPCVVFWFGDDVPSRVRELLGDRPLLVAGMAPPGLTPPTWMTAKCKLRYQADDGRVFFGQVAPARRENGGG